MSDKPAEKPRVLLRPLSGVSSGRLASLRGPNDVPRAQLITPKAQDSTREVIPSSEISNTPPITAQVLSTRQLLATAQQQSARAPEVAPKAKGKVVHMGKNTGVSSTPWKSHSPVKGENFSSSRFSSVAYSADQTDNAYRPQALPLDSRTQQDVPSASLFVRSDGTLRERELMVFQLPKLLPTLPDKLVKAEEDKAVGTPLSELPDGRIGTIRIYKSGRAVAVIGNLEYEVELGHEAACRQEVACICPDESEVLFLGEVNRKVLLTPSLSQFKGSEGGLESVAMQVD